ncbi:hypothetical protein CYMTET_52821 [Cymbomonas tetramitiformis]|uniref:C2 domain-containing protein n=1 Tax=Cymbomonas tetramitiformis TaxID=36881 RepID=A0AAE0BJK6_9CHLO|nr:hypothetical protein CYMTET_52821 [Cymbomonas tetramitiformis]
MFSQCLSFSPYADTRDTLSVRVLEAKNLVVSSHATSCNPYVTAELIDCTPTSPPQGTEVKYNTVNPVWKETLSFPVPAEQHGSSTQRCKSTVMARLRVYNRQMMGLADELLGETTFEAGNLGYEETHNMWLDLSMRKDPEKESSGSPAPSSTRRQRVQSDLTPGSQSRLHVQVALGSVMMPANFDKTCVVVHEPTYYIYISVLAGRNLPTENTGLYFAAFCNILVNSSPDATCSTETLTTDANPVWGDGDIKTFRYYPGITKYATIEVCDGNVVGHNVLGQVRIPIPQPNSGSRGDEDDLWYSLSKIGDHEGGSSINGPRRQAGLGELQVRVDWGYLAKPALLLSQRPSYRKKLGSLKVEVLECRDLINADQLAPGWGVPSSLDMTDCYVKVKVEGCEERTTTVQNCLNPHFFEAFEFDVTEIISNLMVEAWDEDFIDDDDYFGMISIPIVKLLRHTGKRVVVDLPLQHPEGMTELQRPQKLAGHQGTIRLALTLTMTARAPEMYMGQMLMYYDPLEYPASYDTERLWVEVGRLVDVLVAPITSSLLCLLYLQSWGSPMYNMLVIVYTVARYKFFGAYAVQLLPLTLILDLCGIGWLLSRVRRLHPFTMSLQEAAPAPGKEEEAAKKEERLKQEELNKQLGEVYGKSRQDTAVFGPEQRKVASDAATVMDPFTNLILPPFMTSILESLTYVLHTLISTTNSLERVANILVWKDTSVSLFTGWLLLLSTGMLCAVWTMLLYAWARIPFGLSEVLLCSKLFAVLPVAFATKEFVLGIDMLLLQLRGRSANRAVHGCGGSGEAIGGASAGEAEEEERGKRGVLGHGEQDGDYGVAIPVSTMLPDAREQLKSRSWAYGSTATANMRTELEKAEALRQENLAKAKVRMEARNVDVKLHHSGM